jgi:hypothetical protein
MRNEELEMAAPKGPASQRPEGLASPRKSFGFCWLKTWNRESVFLLLAL